MKTTVSACVAGRLCNKINFYTTSELVIIFFIDNYQQLLLIYKTIIVYLIVRNAKSKIQERFCDFHAKEKESQTAYMRNKQLITFFGLVASICPNCHLLFLQQLDTDDHTHVCTRLPVAADIATVGFGLNNTKKTEKRLMPKKRSFYLCLAAVAPSPLVTCCDGRTAKRSLLKIMMMMTMLIMIIMMIIMMIMMMIMMINDDNQ